jgi:hypothetical protein
MLPESGMDGGVIFSIQGGYWMVTLVGLLRNHISPGRVDLPTRWATRWASQMKCP